MYQAGVVLRALVVCTALASLARAGEPRLVVVIVVDQMRGDDVATYEPLWRAGMRRLLDDGRWYTRAFQPHGNTETAAGHATLGTGLSPRWHGVVHKRMFLRERGAFASVCEFGGDDCSAAALLEPTLGDVLKAERPRARVVAVAAKARAANLLAGRTADLVAWLDGRSMRLRGRAEGNQSSAPPWLEQRYEQLMAPGQIAWTWSLPVLPEPFSTRLDAAPGEVDEGHGIVFPHVIDASRRTLSPAWFSTPDVDRVVVELALEAARRMRLGGGGVPDLLLISLSATDGIGHSFGPDSLERAAGMVALDAHLGRLMAGLEALAPGRVVVALTSDHGVAPTIAQARAHGLRSDRVSLADLNATLEAALATAGLPQAVAALWPPFVTLRSLPQAQRRAVLDTLVATLTAHPAIRAAWASEDLVVRHDDGLSQAMFELCHATRGGDIVFAWEPYHTEIHADGMVLGAEHGTPWDYDRHVPLLLLGTGGGRSDEVVGVTDLIATLRQQLGLYAEPRGGRVLR